MSGYAKIRTLKVVATIKAWLSAAGAMNQCINTYHYVDMCREFSVEQNQWLQEATSELLSLSENQPSE